MRGKGLAMHALDQKIRAQEERGKRNEETRNIGSLYHIVERKMNYICLLFLGTLLSYIIIIYH